jgi:hypothetical protein
MGIDIHLVAKTPGKASAKALSKAAIAWLDETDLVTLLRDLEPEQDDSGAVSIAVPVWPADSNVTLVFRKGCAELEARTSTLGPGYHQHVCLIADELGKKLGISWGYSLEPGGEVIGGDETGYFTSRDRPALERAMTGWFKLTARSIVKQMQKDPDSGADAVGICMPTDVSFSSDDPIQTPLGPRPLAWLRSVAESNDDRSAREFFPWWDQGQTPRTIANRAILHMWNDIRWREPLSEDEARLQLYVHELLETAHRADPRLDLPCREWRELLSFGVIEDVSEVLRIEIEHEARKQKGPLIGYRRREITRRVGPVQLTVPGDFGEALQDGGGTLVLFDEGRSVSITCMTVHDPDGEPNDTLRYFKDSPPPEMPTGARPAPPHDSADFAKRGHIARESEEEAGNATPRMYLSGIIVFPRDYAIVTIQWAEDHDEPWALEAWKSLRDS